MHDDLVRLKFCRSMAGNFYLDGGAMFGVVPKTLWEKKVFSRREESDSAGREFVAGARARQERILVETGNGTKWDPKLRNIYGIQDGDPLNEFAGSRQVCQPKQIDLVINTHLHFDHCWGKHAAIDGRDVPTFPNAQVCGAAR